MKKLLIMLLSLVAAISCAFGLAACGGGKESTQNQNPPTGTTVQEAYAQASELGYTGTLEEFVAQISGTDGVGIKSVTVNDSGELILQLTDGKITNCGKVAGADGKNGVGIDAAYINSKGNLILIMTDGTSKNCGKVVGVDGLDGTDGKDGEDGKNGRGINTVYINSKGELIVKFTDGSESNCGKVVGTNGIHGVNGKDGKDGADGKDGVDGKDGADGKDGQDGKDGEDLTACEHTFSGWTVGLASTCTSIGYNTRTCSECGFVEYEFTQAVGHEWDDGTVVFEPECIKNGLLYYTCLGCGDTKSQIIYATGEHVYKKGICIYCNKGYAEIIDAYYNSSYGYNYFATLENGEKFCNMYDAIDESVISFHNNAEADAQLSGTDYVLNEIDFSEFGLTRDEAVSVWKTYLDDKPLYYWLSKTLTVDGNNIVLCVEADYAEGTVRCEYNESLYSIIDEFKDVAEGESAYTIALAYHDMIIDKIDYAYNSNNKPEDAAWAHNITGVFEEKGAVCEGYARAFQLLLNMRGIENIFVTGESYNQKHAWNLVKLDDGKWYWYDLTLDDTPDYYWGIAHDYACAADEEFLTKHTIDSSAVYGADFLYELPARSKWKYIGDELKFNDVFTIDGTDYVVVGYDKVNLSLITSGGNYSIPETVSYRGREFTVVSLMRYEKGKPSILSIFHYDKKFISVHIPSSVIYMSDEALSSGSHRTDLEYITVDENNPKFTAVDGVLFSKKLYTLIQYPQGSTKTEYTIPEETHYIARHAFYAWIKLESLHIGKNVCCVGVMNLGKGYVDYGDTPKVVSVLSGEWHFILDSMENLNNLTIDAENKTYKVKDGMVLNFAETKLYSALYGLEFIEIPDTVTTIEVYAFFSFHNLKTLVIPTSVTEIGDSIDGNIHHLDVFYKGTKTQWNKIRKKDSSFHWIYGEYKTYLYLYSDEEPLEDGDYWHYVDGEITKW